MEEFRAGVIECIDGSWLGSAELLLELGRELLQRVEVWLPLQQPLYGLAVHTHHRFGTIQFCSINLVHLRMREIFHAHPRLTPNWSAQLVKDAFAQIVSP